MRREQGNVLTDTQLRAAKEKKSGLFKEGKHHVML
jgi:hypothetical protein